MALENSTSFTSASSTTGVIPFSPITSTERDLPPVTTGSGRRAVMVLRVPSRS
jgi:hypothetical protein